MDTETITRAANGHDEELAEIIMWLSDRGQLTLSDRRIEFIREGIANLDASFSAHSNSKRKLICACASILLGKGVV